MITTEVFRTDGADGSGAEVKAFASVIGELIAIGVRMSAGTATVTVKSKAGGLPEQTLFSATGVGTTPTARYPRVPVEAADGTDYLISDGNELVTRFAIVDPIEVTIASASEDAVATVTMVYDKGK